jgi:SAM-dependent methyltransferase
MTSPKEKAARHYQGNQGSTYQHAVHGQQIDSPKVYRAKTRLARYRYFRDLPPETRIFEFGIGAGTNLAELDVAEKAGYDLSETARQVSRDHGISVFDDMNDVPDHHYDVVLARHVLEHVPDPVDVITLLKNKLAPKGRLIIIIPVERGPLHQRAISPNDVHQHLYSWKLNHLANLLRLCGLSVTHFNYQWYSMQRILSWMPDTLGMTPYHLAVTLAGHLRRQSETVLWATPT